VPGHELDGSRTQAPQWWAFAARAQQLQVLLEVGRRPGDAQGATGLAGEGVEVLVARKRARLLLEAPHQPVEELAHDLNLPPGAGENRLDFHLAGRTVRAICVARASPSAPRQVGGPQANSSTSVRSPSAASYVVRSAPSCLDRRPGHVPPPLPPRS